MADGVGHSFEAGAAVPAPAHMPARQLHRQRVARALELRRIADADQDLGREFLQIARHREQHRRRHLEYRRRNVPGIVAEMRNELRDHRQRNRDVAAENVAERQIGDGAVRLLAQRSVVLHEIPRRGEMLAVGDQRAFGMSGRAGGVDDEGWVCRRQALDPPLEPIELTLGAGQQRPIASELGMVIAEHRGIIDHHDVPQVGQPLNKRQNPVGVFLVLGNEQDGAAVAHLIFDFGGGGGRIDAVDDRAERLRRQIADHPFLAALTHDGDALARLQAELGKCLGGARDQKRVVAPCPFTIDAAMLGAEGDATRAVMRQRAKEHRRRRSPQGVRSNRNCSHGAAHDRAFPFRHYSRRPDRILSVY